jgi:hypothetical protein
MWQQTILGQQHLLRGKLEEQKVSPDPEQSRGARKDVPEAGMDRNYQQSTTENDYVGVVQLERAKTSNCLESI